MNENVANEINEQSIDAIFANFDVNLNVNNEKCKRFDKIICFDVAKMTNEINEFLDCFDDMTNLNNEIFVVFLNEINKIVEIVVVILFFSLLKFRFETILFIFFVV